MSSLWEGYLCQGGATALSASGLGMGTAAAAVSSYQGGLEANSGWAGGEQHR